MTELGVPAVERVAHWRVRVPADRARWRADLPIGRGFLTGDGTFNEIASTRFVGDDSPDPLSLVRLTASLQYIITS